LPAPEEVDVWVGLDVGKEEHFAEVLDDHGERLFSLSLANDQAALEALAERASLHGVPALVIDQPGSIAQLALAVAREREMPVAYVPGLVMRRAADLYPGEAKTDKRDAFVIADTARTRRRQVHWLDAGSDDLLDQLRVPGGRQPERHGKDGPQSMNDVEAKEQRDAKAALLNRKALESIGLHRVGDEEKAPHLSRANLFLHKGGLEGETREVEILRELPGFLFEGHCGQQRVDPLLDLPSISISAHGQLSSPPSSALIRHSIAELPHQNLVVGNRRSVPSCFLAVKPGQWNSKTANAGIFRPII